MAGALLASACTNAPPPAPVTSFAWVEHPPRGCVVGFSGPTLDPGRAIRRARVNALEALAAGRLGVVVDSELRISSGGVSEVTTQEISGVLANSRIVAMGSGRVTIGDDRGGRREVYALACPSGTKTPGIPRPGFPDWILNIPSEPDRICVSGVGGPTRNPNDQGAAALRDAHDALAHAVETRVRRMSLDDGKGLARVASETDSTERARDLVARVDSLDAEWLDVEGRGPVAIAGVLYGLACVEL